MISHCGVKGYGIQDIAIIGKLIREVTYCFFISHREKKKNVYARTTPNGATYLTTNPHGSDINGMNILPEFKRPFLGQLIESVH